MVVLLLKVQFECGVEADEMAMAEVECLTEAHGGTGCG